MDQFPQAAPVHEYDYWNSLYKDKPVFARDFTQDRENTKRQSQSNKVHNMTIRSMTVTEARDATKKHCCRGISEH